MTTQTETEREPVRKSITVGASVEHAFTTFTEGIAQWWPLDTHSVAAEMATTSAVGVAFDGRPGGRLYEQLSDGRECDWGEVLVWEPPNRIVLTWHPGYDDPAAATEVEVRFSPDGDRTKVDLEHRGWERLRGRVGATRDAYDSGWDPVLRRYAEAA